ncbi:unnamed protein product [Rhizoctonia solani]|uniref:Uncharacterized protein n=1 Tax=Rhizoctonia solani TaxID=456999 RepID=A0A8H3CY63_9AGAM|nr:unnamed protein product [Rhizoctonia solani]
MASHASWPGAMPARVKPHAYQLGSDHGSPNHPTPPSTISYALPSNADYDYVPNDGHTNTPILANQSNDVRPGINAATINPRLRLQLKGSGLLDSYTLPNSSPVPGTIFPTITLFPSLPCVPPVGPSNTTSPLAFEAAVDEDDIVTEHIAIATGAPRAQQNCRFRLSSYRFIFNSDRQSPAPVQPNPGPSQRVFSVPVPTFEVPPEVPLPPSAESSCISVVHPTNLNAGVNEILRRLRSFSLSPGSPLVRTGLNHSHSSDLGRVTRVSPPNIHHLHAIAWGRPRSICSREFATCDRSVIPYYSSLDFGSDVSSGLSNYNSFLVTSTPVNYRSRAPFGYDDSDVQAGSSTGVEQYSESATGSPVSLCTLGYPEEPALDTGNALPPSTPLQRSTKVALALSYGLTSALPPDPLAYVHRPAQFGWINGVRASFPFREDPEYPNQADSGQVVYTTTWGGFECSFSSSTESSASYTGIVGNGSEWSPFGPAIHPEAFEGTTLASTENKLARPVHVRPLASVTALRGAQTDSSPPIPPMECDESDESLPPTPCPPPRELRQYPLVGNAYSHAIESFPSAAVNPENTLPPLGYPENPSEVTLPSIEQVFAEVDDGEVLEGVNESEELEETGENGTWDTPAQSWGWQVLGELQGSGGYASEWPDVEDERNGSESGHEGDDEDESDGKDECYEYLPEDGLEGLEYVQFASA